MHTTSPNLRGRYIKMPLRTCRQAHDSTFPPWFQFQGQTSQLLREKMKKKQRDKQKHYNVYCQPAELTEDVRRPQKASTRMPLGFFVWKGIVGRLLIFADPDRKGGLDFWETKKASHSVGRGCPFGHGAKLGNWFFGACKGSTVPIRVHTPRPPKHEKRVPLEGGGLDLAPVSSCTQGKGGNPYIWVWLKKTNRGGYAGFGTHVSTYQGKPFWYRVFEPQPFQNSLYGPPD